MSRRFAWSIIIAGIIGAGLLFLPFITALELSDFKTRQKLLLVSMRSGEEFTISFIHSVNRRPVYDTLRVESDHLVIVRSRYDSFGAGMPESSTGEGTFAVAKDGWLEWTVNRPSRISPSGSDGQPSICCISETGRYSWRNSRNRAVR